MNGSLHTDSFPSRDARDTLVTKAMRFELRVSTVLLWLARLAFLAGAYFVVTKVLKGQW